VGGIDLSVGPLAGFLVVVASFFVNDDKSSATVALGFALMFVGALITGLVNGLLIRFANFTAIAATLAMYIGLQGLGFLLRDSPGGYISAPVVDVVNRQIGPIPLAFLVLVAFASIGEYMLRRTRPGWRLRAMGCEQEAARRIGVRIDRTYIAAFVLSSLLTAFGAVMLMAQIGVGDPRQGANYTLSSITAVVLGGYEPARRARHVHRHGAGRAAADGSAQRRRLSGPVGNLSIRVPGRTDPCVGAHLFDRAATRRRLTLFSGRAGHEFRMRADRLSKGRTREARRALI
jgi:ribose/xylose/arabinose/galactoside ABC-type transport system permease subunit